jgi:hypothetical protein
MQTIWDLLPASLWPTQPFIPPDEAARTTQMLQALQASAISSSPYNRVDTPWTRPLTPMAPASGGEDHFATSADTDVQGGILDAIFGEAANSSPATNPWMLQPPTPRRSPLGLVGNAPLAAPPAVMAQWAPGATDGPGMGAAPTAAPGLGRAVGDLPARTPQSRTALLNEPPTYIDVPGIGVVPTETPGLHPEMWPEAISRPLSNLWPNIKDAAVASKDQFYEGFHDIAQGGAATGTANVLLGFAGVPFSPVTGVARTLGQEVTSWTGNPDFGRKVELLAPLVAPAGSVRMFTGPPIKPGRVIKSPSAEADVVSHAPAAPPATPAMPPWLQPANVPLLPPTPPRLALPPSRTPQYVAQSGQLWLPNFPEPPSVIWGSLGPPISPRRSPISTVDLLARQRLPIVGPNDIEDWRMLWNVPTLHTVGIARTTLPGLENMVFEGGSTLVRREAGWPPAMAQPIESPYPISYGRGHAESDLANQILREVGKIDLRQQDMQGHEVWMHLSQPSCAGCRAGLNSAADAGVLKQLSGNLPGVTIHVSADVKQGKRLIAPTHFSILDGSYVRRGKR